ncbi:MAG: T9SS type A sorting domain-containing protein [Candidatus Kapaibacterium sp.]
MKKIIVILLLSVFVLKSQKFEDLQETNLKFNQIQEVFQNELIGDADLDTLKGWKQFKRWEWFWEQRLQGESEVPNAMGIKKLAENYKVIEKTKNSSVQSVTWEKYGPFKTPQSTGRSQGVGRVNDLAISPTNENYMIAGAASGGAWRSSNAGQSWIEIDMTDQLSLGISDIEFAPSDPRIVYMATGDANGTMGSNASYYSVGLLKSTDAGVTFSETSIYYELGESKVITRVIIHPSNPDIVMISSRDGIFKSIDAAKTWNKVFSTTSIKDMEFHPTNPSIVYASSMNYSGINSIYKSTDNGDTWELIHQVGSSRRTELAVTPNAPNNLYVLSCATHRGFLSFEVSTNEGKTFNEIATQSSVGNLLGWDDGSDLNVGQGSYDLAIAVNPKDKNEIYIGGVNIWKSLNGGFTWTQHTHWYGGFSRPEIHADQHQFTFSKSGDRLYVSNDGGLYRNLVGSDLWDELNNGMDITQFYRLGVSQSSPFDVLSGSQDNGTSRYDGQNWRKANTGDGMECAIDPMNDKNIYVSQPLGNLRRSSNGGSSFTSMLNSDIISDYGETESGGWVTPYVISQSNPKNIYAGYFNVWKNTNYGNKNNWTKISDFGNNSNLSLVAIAVAENNENFIYAATTGVLRRSTNGGIDWEVINLSSNAITYIAINPDNPYQIYVTKSGYKNNDKVLFYNGTDWKDISGNLPAVPINTVVIENPSKNSVYIGTDIGVFYSDLNTGYWKKLEGEMPNTVVNELEIHKNSGKLYAATYGRGLWRTDLLGCESVNIPINIIGDLEFCEGDSIMIEATNSQASYLWNTGETTKRIVVKESGNYVLTNPTGSYCVDKSNIVNVNVLYKDESIISIPDGNTICSNKESIRLSAPFNYSNVEWSTGQKIKFINVEEPGKYTILATNNKGCEVRDTIEIFKSSLKNDIEIHQSGDILSVPDGYNYRWFLNDTLIENNTSNKINITKFGKYKVEITDEYGCKLTPAIVEVLSSIKPIADNKNIKIYPTETNGIVNISLNDPSLYNAKIELYNILGIRLIELQSNKSPINKLDLTNYSKGAYIIKITDENSSYFQKIILK